MLTISVTLEAGSVEDAMDKALHGTLDLLLDRVTLYPPPIPGSPYVRGGPGSENLGQKWTSRVTIGSGNFEGELGNNVSYGPFVQSEEFQATIHQGRWSTIEQIVESEMGNINAIFAVQFNQV